MDLDRALQAADKTKAAVSTIGTLQSRKDELQAEMDKIDAEISRYTTDRDKSVDDMRKHLENDAAGLGR